MANRLPVVGGDNNAWGSVLNGFLSEGHNADGTHRPFYLASEYGLVGDNSTDNLAAWNTLMTTMATNGGIVLMDTPGGAYRHSGALAIAHNNITVLGLGRGGLGTLGPTVFRPTYASGNVFTITGFNVKLQDFSINASLTRTGGYDADIATAAVGNPQLINLYCQASYNGFHVNGVVSTVDNCELRNVVNNVITIDDNNAEGVLSRILHDASPQAAGGIVVSACGALQIADCDIIHGTYDLHINPAVGQIVSAVYASNTYFDTASGGLRAEGGGVVQSVRFVNCWFCNHSGNGVDVEPSGAGCHFISFENCEWNNNGVNGAAFVTCAGHVGVYNCHGGGNATGLYFGSGAPLFSLLGGYYGSAPGLSTQANGLIIDSGTYTAGLVDDVILHGNTTNLTNASGSGVTVGRIIN